MSYFKKMISALLCLCMLLCVFVGCEQGEIIYRDTGDDESATISDSDVVSNSDSGTASDSNGTSRDESSSIWPWLPDFSDFSGFDTSDSGTVTGSDSETPTDNWWETWDSDEWLETLDSDNISDNWWETWDIGINSEWGTLPPVSSETVTDKWQESETIQDSESDSAKDTEIGWDSESASETWLDSESDSASESQLITSDTICSDFPDSPTYYGATVNILHRSGEQYGREWTSETDKPDTLQTAIFKRNTRVEDQLDVDLNFIANTNSDEEMNDLIIKDYKAGTGKYQIISNYAAYATNVSVFGGYMNLRNDQFENIQLDKGYWNQNFISAAESYGKLFVCVGDVNLSVYDRATAVFFNKDKVTDYLGDYDMLYQLVLDGEWTYDVFYEMAAEIHEDMGTTDESDDIYGVASIIGSEFCDGFLYSMGASLTQKDLNGERVLVTDSNYEKLSATFDMVADFWAADGTITLADSTKNLEFFTAGQALFDIDVIYRNQSDLTMLKEMKDGYGILPMPMYDTDQEGYKTGVQDTHNVISVPFHTRFDFYMISDVLEAFCSLSYSSVYPMYVEKMIKGQVLERSASDVFFLITDGIDWDFADVYASSTGNIRNKIWRGPLKTIYATPGSTDFAQAYAGAQEAIRASLEEVDTFLEQAY